MFKTARGEVVFRRDIVFVATSPRDSEADAVFAKDIRATPFMVKLVAGDEVSTTEAIPGYQ